MRASRAKRACVGETRIRPSSDLEGAWRWSGIVVFVISACNALAGIEEPFDNTDSDAADAYSTRDTGAHRDAISEEPSSGRKDDTGASGSAGLDSSFDSAGATLARGGGTADASSGGWGAGGDGGEAGIGVAGNGVGSSAGAGSSPGASSDDPLDASVDAPRTGGGGGGGGGSAGDLNTTYSSGVGGEAGALRGDGGGLGGSSGAGGAPAAGGAGPTAIQFAGVWQSNVTNGPSITIEAPSFSSEGDFLFMSLHTDVSETRVTAPPEWRSRGDLANTTQGFHSWWFYRFVADGDPTSYEFSVSAPTTISAAVVRYTGVNQTDPFDEGSVSRTGVDTCVAPSISPRRSQGLMFIVAFSHDQDPEWSAPGTVHVRANPPFILIADFRQLGPGPTSPQSFGCPGEPEGEGAVMVFGLVPAGG